eukprot:CAMPEP_0181302192 /NCGR_PEP_ID=MMETSP1101-20121128/7842_1 /TAXON_ID=46948 /ORGANISM="Rhodomonas abbreviata, Strain Caron Lab Isolate" /LENGTH=566 /DNA_ID=CAMNT_0023407579 /DNA_START=31 /DNA_END=1729 /DNA_ORIENTATION=-
MNVLLRRLAKVGNGYVHSSGHEYNVLAFADDLCLLTDSAEKMQLLVDQVTEFADWSGMWVNVGKSEITAYDFSNRVVIEVDSIRYRGKGFKYLHPGKSYKYLGFHVTMLQNWGEHKEQVRAKIDAAMENLKDTLYLPTQTEEMVRMCVIPLFRYSAALVPWTGTELAELSTKFGMAVKNAWKVTKHCGKPVLTADTATGGWNAPLAESLIVQERWGLLQQSMAHDDDVKTLVEWRIKRMMNEMGTETVAELQAELADGKRRGDSWLAHLLVDMHTLQMPLVSRLDAERGTPSLSSVTAERRGELNKDIASMSGIEPRSMDEITRVALEGLRQERSDIRGILRQLRGRGISRIDQIVGNRSVLERVPAAVPDGERDSEQGGAGTNVLRGAASYHKLLPEAGGPGTSPEKEPQRSRLARWLDGPEEADEREEEEIQVRGTGTEQPYWDDRIAYDRLNTIVARSGDGKLVKCRFGQVIADGEKKVEKKCLQEVAEVMVRNRATITIEDMSKYWENETGSCKIRVDGYKRFRIGEEKRKCFCYTGTIIDASNPEEIGARIDKGIPVWGKG